MRKFMSLLLCLLLGASQLWAQSRTLTGKVVDEKGNPIGNAAISVKGSSVGTTADGSGSFKLTVPPTAKTLVISSLNYETLEVTIGAKTTFSISLKPTGGGVLDEVVVTGVKAVKRTEYSGSTVKLTKEITENKPVGSFDQMLQGNAPGVAVITTSGQPGTASNVTIRGTNSVSSGSNPLYIIDGIPVEGSVFQGINPNDIETMDVLKDAAASALYGSRGGAGVIVITTKRGSSGKMKLGYSVQLGQKAKPEFSFRAMNTSELLKAQEDYFKIAGGTGSPVNTPGWYYSKSNPRYTTLTPAQQATEALLLDSISKINTNWNDYIFRNGSFNRHQLTLSGGTGKTRIYSNLEYFKEVGTTDRTDMKRGSWRTNVDYADEKFTLALSSAVAYTRRNFQQSTTTNSTGNPFLVVNIGSPYAKVYKDANFVPLNGTTPIAGYFGKYAVSNGANFVVPNQLDLTDWDENYNDQLKATFSINASYKLTKNLTAGIVTGFDFRETQGTSYSSRLAFLRLPGITTSVTGLAGGQAESFSRVFQFDVRPTLNYTKTFAQKHKVEVLAVGEFVTQAAKSFNLTGYGIDPRTPNTPAVITQGSATNSLFAVVGGGKTQNSLVSGLINGSYTFNNKYSVTGSFRSDGSSRLPEKNRWQDFYSIGGVWTISKENFMRKIDFVNELRLRASYGGAGNNGDNFPFSDYSYQAQWVTNAQYAGLPFMGISSIGNPDLVWETTWTSNVGIDFTLWKNRIRGSVDYYNKETKDIYLSVRLGAEAGGYTTNQSKGLLRNRGVEASLAVDVVKTKDLTWTVNANFALNRNKLVSLGGVASYTVGTSYLVEGMPLGSHYEVAWAGVDAATGQPLYYTKDGKLTTTYAASDKVQNFGTYEAPWKGGFGTSVSYKNLSLSALFSWQRGSTKMDNLEYFVENPVGFLSVGYNQSSSLNFWKKPGDVATTPSPLYSTNFSSKLIHDASFLRFRDLTLAYSVPQAAISKLKYVSRIRFYVQGTNLFIWTKWRGMDPEAGPVNINLSEYPNPRGITGGLDITF